MDLGSRIMILGSAGSGKSTLATQLSKITGVQVIHLDRFFWNPGWVQTPGDEMDEKVLNAASQDSWIIDGNYFRTLDIRLQRASCVIFIDFNKYLCLYRIIKRRFQNRGKTRHDMAEGCPEKLDMPFLKWVWNYPEHSRPIILTNIDEACKDKVTIIIKNQKELKALLEKVERALP